MHTEDDGPIAFEQPEADSGTVPGLEMDMELRMAQVLSQAREATQALRHAAADRSPGPTTHAKGPPWTEAEAETDARGAELPVADFVVELERLANGLQEMVDAQSATQGLAPLARSPVVAGDQVESLLQTLWAEHASLTESVSRLHAAMAAADASMNAFKETMSRFEEATREAMVLRQPDVGKREQRAVQSEEGSAGVAAEGATSDSPFDAGDEAKKRAALAALRSLSI
ncbi:MAG: hypothetical protein OER12_07500 [Acidimicrobiia bacterium]|nr:hypothetical protein [Acidimicrobiia bacterium]